MQFGMRSSQSWQKLKFCENLGVWHHGFGHVGNYSGGNPFDMLFVYM
jgi:hypothetical protein